MKFEKNLSDISTTPAHLNTKISAFLRNCRQPNHSLNLLNTQFTEQLNTQFTDKCEITIK